ncbi:hypothetical protein [Spongiimicrobium salis]|uniref:hypothetical protein n=1 Tax=Spongiimicrobium salis TaxID=1667022 RepID=UPI00374DC1FD
MKKFIQFAAQYLIAAEGSFLPSHGSRGIALQFSTNEHCLHTSPFTFKGDMLVFNHDFFTLEWRSDTGVRGKIALHENPHFEIVRWIEIMALEAGIQEAYRFDKFGYSTASNTMEFLNNILDAPTTINKLTA